MTQRHPVMRYKGAHAELPRVARHLCHRSLRRAEAMCIPISSELTFLLGGAIASGGVAGTTSTRRSAVVIVVGTLAEMVGSYISYDAGRVGGKPLVHRSGRTSWSPRGTWRGPSGSCRARRVGAAGSAHAPRRPGVRVDRGRVRGHPAGPVRRAQPDPNLFVYVVSCPASATASAASGRTSTTASRWPATSWRRSSSWRSSGS